LGGNGAWPQSARHAQRFTAFAPFAQWLGHQNR
jgi:hypothetical protein